MSVDITIPGTGVVGPGIPINLRSDFIGPLGQDASWTIRLFTGINLEFEYVRMSVRAFTVQQPVWLWSDPQQNITATSTAQPAAGDTIRVVAELSESSGIIDTGSTTAPWNPTLGLGLQAVLRGQGAAGGFTAADRANLLLAVDNTTADLTDRTRPPDITSVPIGRLFSPHALIWSERVGPFILTGEGVLDLQARGYRGIWQGLRYFFTRQPPGAGLEPGVSIEFERRVVQLAPICVIETNGEEVFNPIIDAVSDGEFVNLEDKMFSGRVGYSVTPNFEVTLFMYRYAGTG